VLAAGLAVAVGTSVSPGWSPASAISEGVDDAASPTLRGGDPRASAVTAAAGLAGLGGRVLIQRLPVGGRTAADEHRVAPPGGGRPGITPLVVLNDRSTESTPRHHPDRRSGDGRLRSGLVERETELTWDELLALPMVEQYVTIACVSNEVGGNLVGNAKWTGVPLRDALDLAGVLPSASQLVGRSADGWTAGMPTAWVLDPAREPLIAVRMNDDPLPAAHGFPARLIVPGLYGYVSATKWLTELELTTLDAFDAYWVPLGWAKEAPILTQSRIDVPRNGASVLAGGTVALAGVAWAPDRGVARVEIAIDDEWRGRACRARSRRDSSSGVRLGVAVGGHTIRVRATDRRGDVRRRSGRPILTGHAATTPSRSSSMTPARSSDRRRRPDPKNR
jgi:DMSO/TMAO reductase YedYZ molybdopterin-dependent catalytic subunit